ncbi:MAG: YdcF family protein [Bosea sp. (in: a-proteobacteria)]
MRVVVGILSVTVLAGLAGFFAFSNLVDQAVSVSPRKADGIVVLTGGSRRIDEGLELMEAGQGRRLLISGVNERTGHDDVLKLHPDARTWIDCCIDLGAQARNTIGNAIEARRWAGMHGFSKLTVVTSPYHMPRALLELRHAMPDISIEPHRPRNEAHAADRLWREPGLIRILVFEYVKFAAAALRTQLEDDPETSRLAVIFGGRKPVSPKVVKGSFAS